MNHPTTLITGGLGYLGSHMAMRLIEEGRPIMILDNLSNSKIAVFSVLVNEAIKRDVTLPIFRQVDLQDKGILRGYMALSPEIDTVYHFAGLKSVPDSVRDPINYYFNNVVGMLNLLDLISHQVRSFVFSSSAAVYCFNGSGVYSEEDLTHPATPYGETKLMCERILKSYADANPNFRFASLRYFNPAGAHESGQIGEDPLGDAGNLMPNVARAAAGLLPHVTVTGTKYRTKDGSAIRDYVHVMDLIDGHVKAEAWIRENGNLTVNLGTGYGYTVKDLIETYKIASGVNFEVRDAERREGDQPQLVANSQLAQRLLGWTPKRNIYDMCLDSWRHMQRITG